MNRDQKLEKETANAAGLNILTLLREQEILDRVLNAFRHKELPEEVFYWFPPSVRAWTELCRSTDYRNANRALEVLNIAVPDLCAKGASRRTLCGLGCGEGSKDAVLLKAFSKIPNGTSRYLGVDFSQALLELALEESRKHIRSVSGIKCDLLSDVHLDVVCAEARHDEAPVMYTILGNTLGAFNPLQFPERLRSRLTSSDRFLFDGEIFGAATLAGYDNPTNRRFAWSPLASVGIGYEDGQLEFSSTPVADRLFAVTKHFTAKRDLQVNIAGESIDFHAGEMLRMSSSIKYANKEALIGFVESAGWHIEACWSSQDEQFVLACARIA